MRLLPPMAIGRCSSRSAGRSTRPRGSLFAVSTLLGVVVSFGIRFLLNLSAFWLLDARGVLAVWGTVGGLLSPA